MNPSGGRRGRALTSLLGLALVATAPVVPLTRAENPSPPTGAPLARRPLACDLGEGLAFYRAHELPTDLPPAAAQPAPLVLDLRCASTSDSAATALDAWLKFRATPATPVFVLLNAATAADLRHVFAAAKPRPGVLTLGPVSADFTPDIIVPADAGSDQRAYDALEQGAPVATLLTEKVDKPRQDEAALVLARTQPPIDPLEPADESDDATVDAGRSGQPVIPAPAPMIDRPLQRAVQIHRGLVALKRL